MKSGLNGKKGLVCRFFSLYTNLDIAAGDSGLQNDGWMIDSAMVGA